MKQQSLVVRQEEAGALAASRRRRQGRPTAERDGVGRFEAPGDLCHHVGTKAKVERAIEASGAVSRPRSQAGHERLAMEVAINRPRRPASVAGRRIIHELLIIEGTRSGSPAARSGREVRRPALETLGVDPGSGWASGPRGGLPSSRTRRVA